MIKYGIQIPFNLLMAVSPVTSQGLWPIHAHMTEPESQNYQPFVVSYDVEINTQAYYSLGKMSSEDVLEEIFTTLFFGFVEIINLRITLFQSCGYITVEGGNLYKVFN